MPGVTVLVLTQVNQDSSKTPEHEAVFKLTVAVDKDTVGCRGNDHEGVMT